MSDIIARAVNALHLKPTTPGGCYLPSRFPLAACKTFRQFQLFVATNCWRNIVIFVRHGEVLARGTFYPGSAFLSAKGQRQIRGLGEKLSFLKMADFRPRVYSSTSTRTRQSVKALSSSIGVDESEIVYLEDLREIEVGKLRGAPSTIAGLIMQPEYIPAVGSFVSDWLLNTSSAAYPGGESVAQLWERVQKSRITVVPKDDNFNLRLIVGDTVSNKAMMAQLMGLGIDHLRAMPEVREGGFVALEIILAEEIEASIGLKLPHARILYCHNP